MRRLAITLAAFSLISACAPTTRVVATWAPPHATGVAGTHALVVFQHPSEAVRRTVEDALVERIPGAAAAYRVLATDDIGDVEKVKRDGRALGFDTLIVEHLADVTVEPDAATGSVHPPLSPMWGDPLWGSTPTAWGPIWSPSYIDDTRVVTLETLVYSLDPSLGANDLVWTSRTETFDPRTFEDLATAVAGSAAKAMEKDGVIER